jgi:uncharacterized protein (DUF1015 family)
MPDVVPFRGLRYQAGVVGKLADVLVPPYDALTEQVATALRSQSRWNLIELEAPRRPGLTASAAHRAAGRTLREWIARGVLAWDPEPAYYVFRHRFPHNGAWQERTGVIGLAQLHAWSEHVVCPHERTGPAWVADRQSLRAACRADLSLGITLIKDPELRFLSLLRAAPHAGNPVTARTSDGALHEIGRVTDPSWCRATQERLRYARLYVADGHHRYEAALRHRDATQSPGSSYTMLHIVSADDPGLIVLPSHRLIHGALPPDAIELPDVRRRPLPYTLERLAAAWKDDREVWYVSRARVEAFAPSNEHAGADGLSELAHRVVETAGARGDEIAVATTPHAQVAVGVVTSGAAAAAVLVPALEPGVVTQVADQRRTLPPKSTYFWPKPMAGLVLRTLDPPEAFS